MSFRRSSYDNAVKKAKPYTKWIDHFSHARFEFLTGKLAQKIIAFLCIGLACGMIVIGFIPMLPAMFALVILVFGLGQSVHDGLLILAGLIFMALSLSAIPFLL